MHYKSIKISLKNTLKYTLAFIEFFEEVKSRSTLTAKTSSRELIKIEYYGYKNKIPNFNNSIFTTTESSKQVSSL